MWNVISIVLLAVEAVLLASFVVGKFRKKKLNETFIFLGLVFLINLALYLVPYLYQVIVLEIETNYIFDILDCLSASVQLFLGNVDTAKVADFTLVVPVFTYTYLLGALLALLATVSATIEAFSNTIRNSFRLARLLKAPVCDIVLGSSDLALEYAKKNADTVLLLGDSADKYSAAALMEKGFVVLRKGFSQDFLKSRYLNTTTQYNIICPNEQEAYFNYIDSFIAYKKSETEKKNISIFVEIDKVKTETIRREIVEKSGYEELITTFCSNELLARTFAEEHPVTEFLSASFLAEDASVRSNVKINVFMLGFGELSEEIYRQFILNNQLVKFEDGEYKVFPVHYHIYDTKAKKGNWILGGLENALDELAAKPQDHFPLPEMPYIMHLVPKEPHYRGTLSELDRAIREENTFSCVIVDTGDIYQNIETGTRLKSMLNGAANFHIFIRSDTSYTEDDGQVSYYGDFTGIFTHDVIVNDSLSLMAKTLNEVYTAESMKDQRSQKNFAQLLKEKAEESWSRMNYFTLYSNIHAAMSLRVKLNMLGLNYVKDGKGESTDLIQARYQRKNDEYTYAEYFERSKRNALLAQEHARWNAYHLLAEYLPLEKSGITVKSVKGDKVGFNTKNIPAKKHACLTTFKGLDALSSWLAKAAAEKTNTEHKAEEYDYYVYDEMLMTSAAQLMKQLGYSVTEK